MGQGNEQGMTAPAAQQQGTPLSDAQLERDHTLISPNQRITEWRDKCFEVERDLAAARAELEELRTKTADRQACHDAAEEELGCFRAVRAERLQREAEQALAQERERVRSLEDAIAESVGSILSEYSAKLILARAITISGAKGGGE